MGSPREWRVVGGLDKGGILVRSGKDLKSSPFEDRLSRGSTVQEVHLVGDRLEYLLLEGSGPLQGWVSIRSAGKDLLVLEKGSLEQKRNASQAIQVPDSPLVQGVRKGRFPAVVSLLQENADPNESGSCFGRPLAVALGHGDFNIAATLLLYKAEVTSAHEQKAGNGALASLLRVLSAREGFSHKDIQLVLDGADGFIRPWLEEEMERRRKHAQAEPEGQQPLITAVKKGRIDEVLSLLQSRADPNRVDALGETSLFEAAFHPDAEIAAALLLAHADPLKQSISGVTAEHLAAPGPRTVIRAFAGYRGALPSALEVLQEPMRSFVADRLAKEEVQVREVSTEERLRLATVEATQSEDSTVALWRDSGSSLVALAVDEGDLAKVKRLLREGAEVDGCDLTGESPLFEASSRGDADLMAVLLVHRADPLRRSVSGTTAMDLAPCAATKALLRLFAGEDISTELYQTLLGKLSDPDVFEPVGELVTKHMLDANLRKMNNRLRMG